jgi:hypothetical protein
MNENKKPDLKLNNLYLRYYFNRDIGDISRANYWLSRIEEYKKVKNVGTQNSE